MNKSKLRPVVCAILVIATALLSANFLSASKSHGSAESITPTAPSLESASFTPSELNTWLAQDALEIQSIESYQESPSTPVLININIYVTDEQLDELNGANDPI